MLVYCDSEDCKHNKDGICENKWPIGAESIKISENWMGIPYCTDFEDTKDND